MGGSERIAWLSATGNRFAVLDAFRRPLDRDPRALARVLGEDDVPGVDGLLLLLPATCDEGLRMEVYNLDGSRAEACGNGLRCVARLAFERGYIPRVASAETDCGVRGVEVTPQEGRSWVARVETGPLRHIERDASLSLGEEVIRADLVDLGNPHCVLFVDSFDEDDVHVRGAALERHPRFPNRTNVEFVTPIEDGLGLRVWERGVGETESCGSGATAAAMAAILRSICRSPVDVLTRGGRLTVEWEGAGSAWLRGEVGYIEPAPSVSLRVLAACQPPSERSAR